MKRIIKISSMLLFATVFLASCLEDADDDIVYSSDAAIISFSVTNFNTYHKTQSSKGEDSTYMVKEDGKKYKFYIDQTNNKIYNTDSLPVGTDAEHIICGINTARNGNLFIKSATSDTLSVLYPSDSVDFSSERVIKVVSLDGKYHRDYSVKVNVHKQLADDFVWSFYGTNDIFAKADDMKLLSIGNNLAAFVKNAGNTDVYTASVESPMSWNKMPVSFDASAYKNAITFGGRYFIKDGEKIYSSTNASEWTEEAAASDILYLAGCDKNKIYALSSNGIVYSSDACHTWTPDMLADDITMLPGDEISFATIPLTTNKDIDRLFMIGNRNVDTDEYASVWSRLSEYVPSTEEHNWNYIEQTYREEFRLPRMEGLKVIPYAGGLYAIGGSRLVGNGIRFEHVYFSKDGGITWLNDKRFILPYRFMSSNSFALAVDDVHNIWLLCGETGQIWRGRLNGLAWEEKK